MRDLEARQARPATPRMSDYKGPQIPPGRETRPETATSRVKRAIRDAGRATARELREATGLSSGSVSKALSDLRTTRVVQTHVFGGIEPDIHEWVGDVGFDDARADQIGQNGNDGAHYGDSGPAVVDQPSRTSGVADHEGGAGDTQAADPAELTRMYLRLVGTGIEQLEQAANSGIQPLPADDYRIKALGRLVPMVAPDIGEALTDLIKHVTGEDA
ncbi:MAG: hypothetical protein ACLFVU_02095 [Phycisphaerae bacterium]